MPADKAIGEQEEGRRRRRRPAAAVAEPEPQERGITASKGRPTPSRRKQEEEEDDSGNLATRTVGGIREYFEGVRSELQKVAWPNREETRRLTVIVLITLIIAALILGAISLSFTELFRIGLSQPLILLGFMFIAVAAGFVFWRVRQRRSTSF
jgi:preprotein translocase subunit SecE